jgi:hypothetical protein
MTSLLRSKPLIPFLGKSAPRGTAYSLTCLTALFAGAVAFGDSPPATTVHAQAPQEDVFFNSNKPLPARLAEPVRTIEAPILPPIPPAPVKPAEKTETSVNASTVVRTQAVDLIPKLTTDTSSVVDSLKDYQIVLEPPSPQALFYRLDSDKSLEARMRQQALQRKPPEPVEWPVQPVVSNEQFKERAFARSTMIAEPTFVTYNRLYFEEKNAERYGWDLGAIQPVLSSAVFVKDFVFLPYKIAAKPLHRGDTSAGECWPGDPVPYIVYPPDISVPGSMLEAAVVVGLIAIFP